MSIIPFTRGRRGRARSDGATHGERPQNPKLEHTAEADETQVRRLLTHTGARPIGHAEQTVDDDPAPQPASAAQPDPGWGPLAARRISSASGGRLPAPGQTIELTAGTPQQKAPTQQLADLEGQELSQPRRLDPSGGGPATVVWPPRGPWRRYKDGNQDQAVTDDDEENEEKQTAEPDWFRVRKTDDSEAPDQGAYEVHHHHYYASEPDSPEPEVGEGTGLRRISRSSLTTWWASLTPWQKFILNNGTAAAVGAWGWGLFTAQWDTGLPQWTLALMHDAAGSSHKASTPFIVGGGMVLLAATIGGGITICVEKWLHRLPSFCAAVRFLTHIPVASAGIAVLLFSAHTF